VLALQRAADAALFPTGRDTNLLQDVGFLPKGTLFSTTDFEFSNIFFHRLPFGMEHGTAGCFGIHQVETLIHGPVKTQWCSGRTDKLGVRGLTAIAQACGAQSLQRLARNSREAFDGASGDQVDCAALSSVKSSRGVEFFAKLGSGRCKRLVFNIIFLGG
jgi:hypothetical protein